MRYFYLRWLLSLCFLFGFSTSYAAGSWAFDVVSPAIYRAEQPIRQVFRLSDLSSPPQSTDTLQAVSVQIAPSTGAWVQSRLCTWDESHCVNIQNYRLYTQAFQGMPAQTPLVVIHEIKNWQGSFPPLFIKVQLAVWWKS